MVAAPGSRVARSISTVGAVVKLHNRCDLCGRFARWDDLAFDYTPDTHFTAERIYLVCRRCA